MLGLYQRATPRRYSVRVRSLLVVVLMAQVAAADTTLEVAARGQTLLTARDELILGASIGIGQRWEDRWQVGVRGGFALGDALEHLYADGVVEAGVWLHPSRKVDFELGWRAGYSYIHLKYGAHVHALMIENVLALELPRGGYAIRVEPLVFTAYHSGPWQVAIGARAGVGWRF
jgi:hypothetical protein